MKNGKRLRGKAVLQAGSCYHSFPLRSFMKFSIIKTSIKRLLYTVYILLPPFDASEFRRLRTDYLNPTVQSGQV